MLFTVSPTKQRPDQSSSRSRRSAYLRRSSTAHKSEVSAQSTYTASAIVRSFLLGQPERVRELAQAVHPLREELQHGGPPRAVRRDHFLHQRDLALPRREPEEHALADLHVEEVVRTEP